MKWKGEKSPLWSAHARKKSETLKGLNKRKSFVEPVGDEWFQFKKK